MVAMPLALTEMLIRSDETNEASKDADGRRRVCVCVCVSVEVMECFSANSLQLDTEDVRDALGVCVCVRAIFMLFSSISQLHQQTTPCFRSAI